MAKARTHAAAHRAVLKVFELFGQPIRVTIFQRLANEPMTAGDLAKGLPITRPAVVQHLKRLEAAHLVEASTEGRRRVYRIRSAGLAPLDRWVQRHLDS
ncbi:MAG: ArsR/SmtB family transcription factor [Phenylobacterium sp.]